MHLYILITVLSIYPMVLVARICLKSHFIFADQFIDSPNLNAWSNSRILERNYILVIIEAQWLTEVDMIGGSKPGGCSVKHQRITQSVE